jgi:hypothetical protein
MAGTSNYSPYAPNAQGFTEALIDLKSSMAGKTVYAVAGFLAEAFEDVPQGSALYARTSDGKVGIAVANDTFDKANVVGFAETAKVTGEEVRVLIVGVLPTTGLTPGLIYYLSAGTPGAVVSTPPSTAGHYVTRVGEASSSTQLIVQLEPPIQLH